MLLLTGEKLESATVSVAHAGVHVVDTRPVPGGHYLFVRLAIDAGAKPGDVPIAVKGSDGRSVVQRFPLRPRRAQAGNFQGLSEDDVLYLIMPDRFADGDPANNQPPQSPGTYDRSRARAYHGGDLRGIQDHLDYLRELGVTALWITPIYDNDNASPQDYHGYGAVAYYAVDEHLGTLGDLQDLVTAAHGKGLKIFLDMVPNHTGPRHPWVRDPPEPNWFHGTLEKHLALRTPLDVLVDLHSPPALWQDVIEGWFADILPDLNQENPRVARYLIQNAIWWAEQTGVDGYRLDTFPYVSRRFWSDWHQALRHAYPRFSTIGEVFHPDPNVTAFFAGGRTQYDGIDSGVTTVFDFPAFFALRDVILRGAPVNRIVDVLRHDRLYPKPELLVTFLGNHDVRRFSSEPGSSKEKLKLVFSLLLILRGIPQLYYGDEIGMQGGGDPDNRRDFPGGFSGDARNAFSASGRTADEQEIFSHVQQLLRLRREHPALRRGRHWHIAWDDTFYAFARETNGERLLAVFNNADKSRRLRLNFSGTPLAGARQLQPLLMAPPAAVRDSEVELELPARQLALYRVQ